MSEQMRGAGQPSWPLLPYQIQVSYSTSAGISRDTGADWFGPLNALSPIAPPDIAGRRFDFPAGYNLVARPRGYERIGFAEPTTCCAWSSRPARTRWSASAGASGRAIRN
jgi:hypothetical protein